MLATFGVDCYFTFKRSVGVSVHCWQFAVSLQNAVFMRDPGLRSFVRNVREGGFLCTDGRALLLYFCFVGKGNVTY